MRPSWLTAAFLTAIFLLLEFFASPTGGRDIGRTILRHAGLRGGNGRAK